MSAITQISSIYSACKDRIDAQRHIVRSIGSLASGNLAGALLGAVGGIIVARFIAPEVNGQFRLFTIPLMYMTFFHFGTFDGLSRHIPFYIGRNQPEHVEKLASAAGAWNLGVTSIVASGFLLCALWGLLHGNHVAAAGWFSQTLVCAGVFYGGYLGSTYRTLHNFVVLARIQFIQASIAFCLVLTVVFWGFYGLCLRSAVPIIFGVWLLHRARPLRMRLCFDLVAFKEVIKMGMPLCFWGTLYTSLWMAAEYSLMLHYGGLKGVGLLSVALVMRESLMILPQSVHQVFMPRVVESYARRGGVANAANRTFLAAGVLSFLMLILIFVISWLLNYFVPFFIPKYIDGLSLMKICLGFAVIEAASLPLNGLVATGRSWLYGRGILAGLLTFPLAVCFFNPVVGGMMAVAMGSLLGRLVRTIVGYYDLIMLMRQEAR